MKTSEIAPLVAIAESMDAVAQSRLGVAMAAEREMRERLAALDRPDDTADLPLAPAQLAARALHARWKASRREVLLRDHARLRSVVEVARMEAARALGRKQAVLSLRDAAQHAAQRARAVRQAEILASLTRSET